MLYLYDSTFHLLNYSLKDLTTRETSQTFKIQFGIARALFGRSAVYLPFPTI